MDATAQRPCWQVWHFRSSLAVVTRPLPNIIRMRQDPEQRKRHSRMVGHRNVNVSCSHRMKIIRPPQGNSTIFGRYVTAEYATYVIVLSRLTRIYERKDVREALAKVTKKQALRRVMPRGRKRKNTEKPKDEILELSDDEEVVQVEGATTSAIIDEVSAPPGDADKPKRPIVVKPIGIIQ